jgi:transcriptional regulator with XRE-family HTH domain
MSSSFADRLWWSRHRAGLGATRLARIVGCSQSLISSLERNNAEKSKLSNKFASALQVDPTWLAFGDPKKAPPDFDENFARKNRENMGTDPQSVVRMPRDIPSADNTRPPRWSAEDVPDVLPLGPLEGADAMMKDLTNMFLAFARAAGAERARLLLSHALPHLVELVAFEEANRQEQVGKTD